MALSQDPVVDLRHSLHMLRMDTLSDESASKTWEKPFVLGKSTPTGWTRTQTDPGAFSLLLKVRAAGMGAEGAPALRPAPGRRIASAALVPPPP